MGIKGLNTLLRKHCPEVFEEVHISEYAFKKVAIDISLFLCKFKAICGGDRWLTAFINLVSCLRRNEIHCVFIYDNGHPIEKLGEKEERREQQEKTRQKVFELDQSLEHYYKTGEINETLMDLYNKASAKQQTKGSLLRPASTSIDINLIISEIEKKRNFILNITAEDFEITRCLFDILKVPYYIAPLEAETMCSDLCIRGIVDAVMSEDTDVLAYGSPIFLTKIDTNLDTCVRICYSKVLECLGLSRESFLDLCIMLGTDYNKNIPKIGGETSLKYIRNYGTIDGVKNNTGHDITILNHIRGRELFLDYDKHEIKDIPYCGSPDFDLLAAFISRNEIIGINIDKLKKCLVHNNLIIDEEED